LQRRHLSPGLALRKGHLVETRLLLRSNLIVWVDMGLSGSKGRGLDWELLAVVLSWVLAGSGSPGGLLGTGSGLAAVARTS